MANDRKQPTPIDADEYERFVQFVKEVHGGTRGHLRTEIENALRQYREGYNHEGHLARIEDELATIKAHVAETEADGGTVPEEPSPTLSQGDTTDTHRNDSLTTDNRVPTEDAGPSDATRSNVDTNEAGDGSTTEPVAEDLPASVEGLGDPPHPKTSRSEKLDYLEHYARVKHEGEQATRDDLREGTVGSVYSFADDTAEEYTDALVDRLGAEPHPVSGKFLVWGDALEQANEDARELAEAEARETEQTLDDAARTT